MNKQPLHILTLASALLLSGCLVEIEIDSTDGCVAIDGKTSCSDVILEFAGVDKHTVTAIPNRGFAFSHWKKGRKYLFGASTEQFLTLDALVIEDLPQQTFYLEPVFVPVCRTDLTGEASAAFSYMNCHGDSMSSNYPFADVSGSKLIYKVSVLFYVDTNRPELGRLTAEEFVERQLDIQNKALEQSGVNLRYTAAGVIPVSLPWTRKSQTEKFLQHMVTGGGVFSRITQQRERYSADLVHAMVRYANGPNACGAAYISAIDLAEQYHVGVTACFDAEGPASRYSLAHELGHNLGLVHDHENDDGVVPPTYAFGRGWSRWTGAKWLGSIMSYSRQKQLFSSPENRITDESDGRVYRMGNRNINAVKALNLVRLDYSQIRPKVPGKNSGVSGSAAAVQSRNTGKAIPLTSGGCMPEKGNARVSSAYPRYVPAAVR